MRVSGVQYDVNWRAFTRGRSLFFPSLDPDRAWREDVAPVMRRMKFKCTYKSSLDPTGAVRGLRVWRL